MDVINIQTVNIHSYRKRKNSIYADITKNSPDLKQELEKIVYKKVNNIPISELDELDIVDAKLQICTEKQYQLLLDYLSYHILRRDDNIVMTNNPTVLKAENN